MLSREYVAGFFDGEGCVGVYRNTSPSLSYYLSTQLTQNRSVAANSIMKHLTETYGGNVSEQITATGRVKLNWQLAGDKAASFLEDVLPFLVLKKGQAELAVEWQRSRPKPSRDAKGRIVSTARTEDYAVAVAIKEMKKDAFM